MVYIGFAYDLRIGSHESGIWRRSQQNTGSSHAALACHDFIRRPVALRLMPICIAQHHSFSALLQRGRDVICEKVSRNLDTFSCPSYTLTAGGTGSEFSTLTTAARMPWRFDTSQKVANSVTVSISTTSRPKA